MELPSLALAAAPVCLGVASSLSLWTSVLSVSLPVSLFVVPSATYWFRLLVAVLLSWSGWYVVCMVCSDERETFPAEDDGYLLAILLVYRQIRAWKQLRTALPGQSMACLIPMNPGLTFTEC